jgi:pSer/pThr/pTyr-binding forkhead associated (FHA) protein
MRLVLCGEGETGRVHELADGKTSVGRSWGNMLVIPDESVSRRHGEILVWGNEVIVRDFGSRNGTKVGERLVTGGQCPVRCGELVRFGSVQARLEIDRANTERRQLEDSLEDVTAIHHFSKFQRVQNKRAGDHSDEVARLAVELTPWPEFGEHTMLVERPGPGCDEPAAPSCSAPQEIDSLVPRLLGLLRWLMRRGWPGA